MENLRNTIINKLNEFDRILTEKLSIGDVKCICEDIIKRIDELIGEVDNELILLFKGVLKELINRLVINHSIKDVKEVINELIGQYERLIIIGNDVYRPADNEEDEDETE